MKVNVLKAASWYTIGNILVKSVSFFVLPIFTSLMSTTEYGIYSVYLSYLTILEVVILLGLSSTVKIAKFDKEISFDSYMSTIVSIPVFITVISAIVLNIYLSLVPSGALLSMNSTLWNYLLITSAFSAIAGIASARLIIEGRYKEYILYSAVVTILNVGISLLLCYTVYKEHDIHMARVIGQCVSNAVGALLLLYFIKFSFHFDKNCFKQAMVWGIPLLFHTLSTVILTQSDRIIVKYINGYAASGIYSIAVTLITIPLTLQTSIGSAWSPWYYQKLEEKDYDSIIRASDTYIVLFAVIIGLFMLVSPDVVHLFTHENYWDSIYSLVPLSISVFGEMIYGFPVDVEYYNKQTNYILIGTVSATILNIVLDILMVYQFGYHGAAYATSISKLLLFFFHYHFAKKIDKNKMFDDSYILISIVALIGVNVITLLLVDQIIIRYLIVITIAILSILYLLKNKNDFLLLKK